MHCANTLTGCTSDIALPASAEHRSSLLNGTTRSALEVFLTGIAFDNRMAIWGRAISQNQKPNQLTSALLCRRPRRAQTSPPVPPRPKGQSGGGNIAMSVGHRRLTQTKSKREIAYRTGTSSRVAPTIQFMDAVGRLFAQSSNIARAHPLYRTSNVLKPSRLWCIRYAGFFRHYSVRQRGMGYRSRPERATHQTGSHSSMPFGVIRGKTGPAPSGAVLFGPFSYANKKKDEEEKKVGVREKACVRSERSSAKQKARGPYVE